METLHAWHKLVKLHKCAWTSSFSDETSTRTSDSRTGSLTNLSHNEWTIHHPGKRNEMVHQPTGILTQDSGMGLEMVPVN